MKKVPFRYEWGKPLDYNTLQLVKLAQVKVSNYDDYRGLIVGDTGSGKSHLTLWLQESFTPNPNIASYGLNQESYARAVGWARDARLSGNVYVPCIYDEANVLSVEAMQQYNRELARLMGEIRGLNVFHLWATAQPGRLPADFLDETFDFIIFIYTKDAAPRPRLFYFIDRRGIDRLRSKEGSPTRKAKITLELLRRVSKKYASYKGCFTEYKGKLLEEYNSLKESKINERVDSFVERFGTGSATYASIARSGSIADGTVRNRVVRMVELGLLKEGDDYFVNAAGIKRFSEVGAKKVLDYSSKSGTGAENGVLTAQDSITPRAKEERT